MDYENAGLYGQVADAQADALYAVDVTATNIVHYHRGFNNETANVHSKLSGFTMKACNTHVYPGPGEPITTTIANQLATAANTFGFSATKFVTEWNVACLETTHESGISLANRQLAIFKELLNAGVSHATIWPLMYKNNSFSEALADINGTLRPQGQAYKLLSENAKNTWMVQCVNGNPSFNVMAFKYNWSPRRLSIFITGNQMDVGDYISLTINGVTSGTVTGWRLSAENSTSNDPATLTALTPSETDWGPHGKLTLKINKTFQYEIVRVDISLPAVN